MLTFLVSILEAICGLVCIRLGSSMMKGNISLLHDYHRSRVEEKDGPALGKKAGSGMILVGAGLLAFGILMAAALLLDSTVFLWMGMALFVAGLLVGTVRMMRAVNQYNKGIF